MLNFDEEYDNNEHNKTIDIKSSNKIKQTIPEIDILKNYVSDIRLSKIKINNSYDHKIYYHGVPNINTFILLENNKIILKLIDKTNIDLPNIAEYFALITAIYISKYLEISDLEMFGCNELIIKQTNGLYKVKNDQIKIYNNYLKKLIKSFKSVKINYKHIGYLRTVDC
jgi:hypothetical protein